MNRLANLSEDRRDALQELMNVAMGQGADRLARLTETFVTLSVPRIHPVEDAHANLLDNLDIAGQPAIVTRQSFLGRLRGEVVVCFGENGGSRRRRAIWWNGGSLVMGGAGPTGGAISGRPVLTTTPWLVKRSVS